MPGRDGICARSLAQCVQPTDGRAPLHEVHHFAASQGTAGVAAKTAGAVWLITAGRSHIIHPCRVACMHMPDCERRPCLPPGSHQHHRTHECTTRRSNTSGSKPEVWGYVFFFYLPGRGESSFPFRKPASCRNKWKLCVDIFFLNNTTSPCPVLRQYPS